VARASGAYGATLARFAAPGLLEYVVTGAAVLPEGLLECEGCACTSQLWHARSDYDAGHRWLRQQVKAAVS
jgi:hypothetical protein